jgi:hypothetical protein
MSLYILDNENLQADFRVVFGQAPSVLSYTVCILRVSLICQVRTLLAGHSVAPGKSSNAKMANL